MHYSAMRTTVNLDPDAFSFAQAYAGGKGISLSAALSELVRRAERAHETDAVSDRLKKNEHGYLEIASTSHVLTPEMVKSGSEDELVG
jgi:hypothetical protein